MRGIFLNQSERLIRAVYGPEQMRRLHALVRIEDEVITPTGLRDGRGLAADVVFSTWGMPSLTQREIETYLPNVWGVFYAAGTVQPFARPFFSAGRRVFSGWQANAVPVAEYTFAQITLALKGYFQVQTMHRHDRAASRALFENYPGCYDVTVGLLGCGAIGSLVAQKLKDLHVRTLAFDPYLSEARAGGLGVTKASLEQVFAECDVVSNHLANLPATVGIIRREHLMSMKPYATFINTGRGAQLNEADLYDALTQMPTRTALLDVLIDEANAAQSPLNSLPNCFITPHIAGAAGLDRRRMAEYIMDAYQAAARGEKSACEVTPQMLETMA